MISALKFWKTESLFNTLFTTFMVNRKNIVLTVCISCSESIISFIREFQLHRSTHKTVVTVIRLTINANNFGFHSKDAGV